MFMIRFRFVALCVLCGFSSQVLAATVPSAQAAAVPAAVQTDAPAFITQLGNEALSVITSGQNKAQKQPQLEAIFSKYVDIPWVARFVMGRYWRQATETQKEQYVKEYRGFVLSHYSENFVNHSQGSFNVGPSRPDERGYTMVLMTITAPGQPDVLLDYRLTKQPDGNFKIVDVVVEGVSLITTQRSEFASVIERNGIDYLISQLSHRTTQANEKK